MIPADRSSRKNAGFETPVSYTHLDVYKRQSLRRRWLPWTIVSTLLLLMFGLLVERQRLLMLAARHADAIAAEQGARASLLVQQPGQDGAALALAIAATAPSLRSARPVPVSYTHLDVYKRQLTILRRSRADALSSSANRGIPPVDTEDKTMAVRIGINGFGRIGRCLIRAWQKDAAKSGYEIVARCV